MDEEHGSAQSKSSVWKWVIIGVVAVAVIGLLVWLLVWLFSDSGNSGIVWYDNNGKSTKSPSNYVSVVIKNKNATFGIWDNDAFKITWDKNVSFKVGTNDVHKLVTSADGTVTIMPKDKSDDIELYFDTYPSDFLSKFTAEVYVPVSSTISVTINKKSKKMTVVNMFASDSSVVFLGSMLPVLPKYRYVFEGDLKLLSMSVNSKGVASSNVQMVLGASAPLPFAGDATAENNGKYKMVENLDARNASEIKQGDQSWNDIETESSSPVTAGYSKNVVYGIINRGSLYMAIKMTAAEGSIEFADNFVTVAGTFELWCVKKPMVVTTGANAVAVKKLDVRGTYSYSNSTISFVPGQNDKNTNEVVITKMQ